MIKNDKNKLVLKSIITNNKKSISYIAFAIFLIFSPFFLNVYWVDVLNNIGLYAILALSLNLILGYAGLFHMGHAAFYAIGAYIAAILSQQFGIPILWLLPLCGLGAGLFALIVARPIIHLRGDYLLIVTIGVVEIVRIALVNNVGGVTGGANGLFGIARPTILGLKIWKPIHFFYLIWAFGALTIFLFYRLEYSRFGRALKYIKEDEVAAEGCGINTTYYKLIAFVIGAVWAGMTGNLFAAKMSTISPESFSFWESVILFTIVIIGGSGSIHGVILGAFIIIGFPEILRGLPELFKVITQFINLNVDLNVVKAIAEKLAAARMMFFGLGMIIMMIFRNQGLFPAVSPTYSIPKMSSKNQQQTAKN